MKKLVILLAAGLVAILMAPAGGAFHGSWWRARDLPASNLAMGLNHDLHPTSTATDLRTGQILRADVEWSGQQFIGGGFDGLLTLTFRDAAGLIVHQNTIPAIEDISNVHWL